MFTRSMVEPFEDISVYVANGAAAMASIAAAGTSWPVTLGHNRQDSETSWIASVNSALLGTAREEMGRSAERGWRTSTLNTAFRIGESVGKHIGLNDAAIVNNTLLSVSPEGFTRLPALCRAVAAASEAWPRRIILARGIIADPADIQKCLKDKGAVILPNRISYSFDLRDGKLPAKINAQRDVILLEKAGLEVMRHQEFSDEDLSSALAQYTVVYIERHGRRNPQFTKAFFRTIHETKNAEFWGLKQNGRLAAFVALKDHGDFMSVPLIGYDTTFDRKAGLYRQIFALALRIGAERKAVLNFGAGAGHYKKLRGGTGVIEYMIIAPPKRTPMGFFLRTLLGASEEQLGRMVPRAIEAYGG